MTAERYHFTSASSGNIERQDFSDLSQAEKKMHLLSVLNGQINAYGTDESDEFVVVRENGKKQGIFKTWAVPVIPFFESDQLETLVSLWPSLTGLAQTGTTFEENLLLLSRSPNKTISVEASKAIHTLNNWTKSRLARPYKLKEDLEHARINSLQIDRRLTQIFREEPLPTNVSERIGVLVDRFVLATSLEAPFYNLEAIVGDSLGFRWNPIRIAQDHIDDIVMEGGKLDTLAFLLPSALQEAVVAEKLDWKDLNWNKVRQKTRELLRDPKRVKLLLDISETANVPIHHIVFAANALEWIPVRVGGKKDDFNSDEALQQIEQLLDYHDTSNYGKIIHIGRDANALIRFLNWMPLIEDECNFTESANWTYASVCDTAGLLLNTLVEHPEVWKEEFKDTFISELLPQLQNLDASSAKGRFLTHLILQEARLKPKFASQIGNTKRTQEYIQRLLSLREEEKIHTLGSGIKPRLLIGGKIFGLEELLNNIPLDIKIPSGIALTSESVNDILEQSSQLRMLINRLDKETDMERKLHIAERIVRDISNISIPQDILTRIVQQVREFGNRFVVRSSSHDEDNSDGVTGAGIYESVVNIALAQLPDAIKECIASYFSPKAVQFRQLTGSSDKPHFSVLIQPLIEGKGGVIFTQDLHGTDGNLIIELGNSAENITSGNGSFTRYEVKDNVLQRTEGTEIVSLNTLQKLVALTRQIQLFKGKDIDMEWVEDNIGNLWILQARSLPTQDKGIVDRSSSFKLQLNLDEDIEYVHRQLESNTGIGDIELVGHRNLEAFQGDLFRIIARHGRRIGQILHRQEIPQTSHFANICGSFGIKLRRLE